jgi:two-component system sensor histidine kinase RpfC
LATKLVVLYALNWYCSLTARTVDSIRARTRRIELAKRADAQITGTIAHAIRTGADGIGVLTELLARTQLDPRQQRYLQGLAGHTRNVLNKISLLDASAPHLDRAHLHEAPFSPRELIDEITSLLRPLAESKGLDFRVEIGVDTPLTIRGDAAKIRQVLLGITHNAIRFTETGSVEVRWARFSPGHITFQVQDTGPGIPAYVRRRVSSGFVRADGTEWYRIRGAQIGLSISKRLIDLMDGNLILHSVPSRGSTVSVELPVHGTKSFFLKSQVAHSGSATAKRSASAGAPVEEDA